MVKLLLVCLAVGVAAPAMGLELCNDEIFKFFDEIGIVSLYKVLNLHINFAYVSEYDNNHKWDSAVATTENKVIKNKNGEDTIKAYLTRYNGINKYGKEIEIYLSNTTHTKSRGVSTGFPEPNDEREIITYKCKSPGTFLSVLCRLNGQTTFLIWTTETKYEYNIFADCKEKAKEVDPQQGEKLVELKKH